MQEGFEKEIFRLEKEVRESNLKINKLDKIIDNNGNVRNLLNKCNTLESENTALSDLKNRNNSLQEK